MISSDKAREFIQKHEKISITKSQFDKFSKPYQVLGLIIINQLVRDYSDYSAGFKAYQKEFGTDATLNPWNNKEGLQLANLLFGEIIGPYVGRMWDFMDSLPYQNGYSRRPFRVDPSLSYTKTKLDTLQSIYNAGASGFNSMNVVDQIRYDVYQSMMSNGLFYAVVFQEDPLKYYPLLEEIIQGEDEIGGVSKELIRGLLLTDDDANHLLVEKLLLAAQQQEGLRQTILETLDFTSVKALKRFIKVILGHNLMRFSAVVRAVDTWFGFGWDAPKTNTIKRVLELALGFLEHPNQINDAINSKDQLELYVALWAKAIEDVDAANLLAFQLVFDQSTQQIKKLVSLFFINQTERTDTDLIPYAEKIFGEDIELDYWVLVNLPPHTLSDILFDKMIQSVSKLPTAGKTFSQRGFSWKNYTIKPEYFYDVIIAYAQPHQFVILANDLSVVPSSSREKLMRKIFPDHYTYSWSSRYEAQQEKEKLELEENSWQRKVIRQAISDRNTTVSATGMTLMRSLDLFPDDIAQLEAMLARKGKDQRKVSIQLLLNQSDDILRTSLLRLISSANIDQRLAALEMFTLLQEKETWKHFVNEQSEAYRLRKLSRNEEVFLEKLNKETAGPQYGIKNGFGAIDYSNLTDFKIPESQFLRPKKKLLSFKQQRFLFEDIINISKTTKAINDLFDLFEQYGKYEYSFQGYQGALETTLLGNSLQGIKQLDEHATYEERLDNLPLAEVWKSWYQQADLNDFEIHAAMLYIYAHYYDGNQHVGLKEFKEIYLPVFPGIKFDKAEYYYQSNSEKVMRILGSLMDVFTDHQTWAAYKLDVLEDAIHHFPDQLKSQNFKNPQQYYYSQDVYWTNLIGTLFYTISESDYSFYSREQLFRLYQLKMFIVAQQIARGQSITTIQDVLPHLADVLDVEKRIKIEIPDFELIFNLYSHHQLNKDDLLFLSLINKDLFFLLDGGQNYHSHRLKHYTIPEINGVLKKNMLAVELERGDIPTEASPFIEKIQVVEGMKYFFDVLNRMAKENFDRGYSYGANVAKKYTFSHILKKSGASSNEEYVEFARELKNSTIDKKRLIEVSCYATQWADWLGEYMRIASLEEAVWWFLAHTTDYMDAEKETIISRYSNVPKNDFQKGAIDIDWFHRVYANLGKSNWKIVHESAKYLSDGMGYRRVKIYSSVLLGETKITETLKKITEKRDKDYVMALGLIPISKANPEADLLKRYHILQTFLKESKQFGAQRQESEKNAVEIGLDNLARNAGFEDSIRFVWAMEGKATQQILRDAVVKVDDLEVQLMVDHEGKAELLISRNGKNLKSLPDKYKKNKDIAVLKEGKSYLSKQFSRTKLALENSMLRGDEYSVSELRQIMDHPIVSAMLSKLVLYIPSSQESGFWTEEGLIGRDGVIITVAESTKLIIAHPYHLYQAIQWDLYQRHLFEQAIQQPFKQVFRELYVPTADELEQSIRSARYQGHQIQPQQTIALLRGRGWTVSYEEGLQKVFHKQGYLVTMFAMADWYTPSDVEAPTLELICFYSLKDRTLLPVTAIDPVIFSEVMRDMDLVVSVAHVGEVDPEASHSSMQMRAALARESAQLFGLDNVEIKERHILINGKLADYSIHLGSGMVSKNGRQLAIIPVHSQHRGRVFLPFVDNDPKSAEIISKMRYLAQDNQIKDPTILAQINM
ncbi:DUF4132 domain-containing protein [Sphingobacterium alkalisoli]|uniref:DUF4132 domain-containing protein n=1 Tax=Sphingobacterium alkalisoli TaxID=1874115 RepID=A0A4U0H5Z5_9SPHI|nr:DUF4132 domain-containing protein [Sphingobacterium alkalisoli]TJY66654.1 DUF4132 domain-containing protein [Sphingobacterium alkalisoli]GGH15044.1 hypothetical protein GCM10011418_16440 [Sphingobacterium alkalisoli]